jgi:hypothetical protein
MNIINITSQNELPKDTEFYIFNNEIDLTLGSPDATVYCLTRTSPKQYWEWYVVNEEKK